MLVCWESIQKIFENDETQQNNKNVSNDSLFINKKDIFINQIHKKTNEQKEWYVKKICYIFRNLSFIPGISLKKLKKK